MDTTAFNLYNLIVFFIFFSKLDIKSDTTNWAYPDMKNCDKVVTISEISNITVTPGKRINQLHIHLFLYMAILIQMINMNDS